MLGFMTEVLRGTIRMYLPKGNMTTTPGNLEGLGVDSIGEKDYDPSITPQRINQCDGCMLGLPVFNPWRNYLRNIPSEAGYHRYPDGSLVGCDRVRYESS